MKLKRIMAMVLCFAMVLSTMSFSVIAEGEAASVVTVDSQETFQTALDEAVDGTTIQLTAGVNYGTVKIRPVDGNENTKTGTDYHNTHRYEYVREVKNLTIIGADGAMVDGIEIVTGTQLNSIWYYANIENITIDSVTFSEDTIDYAVHSIDSPLFVSLESARIDGLTVKNCSMDGGNKGQNFVYIYGSHASNSEFETYAKNIKIINNSVQNIARLCELREAENVIISGNTISNTTQHAILLACNKSKIYSGEITIEENTADGIGERFVRMAGAGDATVTIANNEITNYNGGDSDFIKVSDCSSEDAVTIADNTLEGETTTFVYADGIYQAVVDSKSYVVYIGEEGYETLQDAIEAVQVGDTIKLISDIELDDVVIIAADDKVIIDLNGYTISYDSTEMGEAMITNKGELTINDSVGSGVINYNYTGAADASYGKGNYTISNAGTLTINGGKITIANLRAHAKYPIDNNSTTGDAILVINGGHLYNYNTSAIRQFCNSTTNKNSVTINGGLIEGYCAIWVQNPGSKTVNGSLEIKGGEIKTTAKAWVEGTANLTDVSSGIYCTIDGNGGAWSEDSAVSITGGIINENVFLAEDAPAAITIGAATFNGNVETPAPAGLSGSGTEEDPYLISSVAELEFFRDSVNAGDTTYNAPGVWVALANDIDLAGVVWTEGIGDGTNATFDGNFNGNNHAIKNFTMNPTPDADNYLCGGLFGYIYGNVQIKDLVFENVTITSDAAGHNVGVLVGFANNNGGKAEITNVTVKGNIVIDTPNVYGVGAIVGYSYRDMGTIDGCVVEGNNGSYIKGYSFVGGITGYSYSNAVISRCSVNNIDIIATNYSAGGIAGIVLGGNKISDCTVDDSVTVTGQANVGSVVGALSTDTVIIEDCVAAEPMVGGNYSDNKPVKASIGNKYFTSLEEALNAAQDGDTVKLLADIKLTGKLDITKAVTIDGNGHSLIADETAVWYTVSGKLNIKSYKTHLIGINSDNVTLKNIVLDNNDNAAGINVYCAQNVVFDNVSIINATKGYAALTVNGSTLTVKTKLEALGNAVAIDISNGSGVTSALGVTVEDGTIFDLGSKTVKFASVAVNDLTGAKKADGTPYFAARDNAYYYTIAQMESRTTAYSNGLTLLADIELSNDLNVKGTFDLNGKVLKVESNLTVADNGIINGKINLTKDTATVTGPEGLDVITELEGYAVKYANGVYSVGQSVAKIGTAQYASLEDAFAAAQDGDTIELVNDVLLDTMIVNNKKVTLDLNGKTITGTDNTNKNFSLIDNCSELTVTGNGTMTLTATINSGWGRYSAVIANNPGGKLVVENGTIEHLGGTDMAYGIDNLTNGKGTYAETIINDGTIKSTYRGIRQFLNGVEAQNILTINGGTVEGANKSIWMHDPSAKANTGKLTVADGATLNGDVYLFVTAGSTEWPVEVSIAASAVNGQVLSANVPFGYEVAENNGYYGVAVITPDAYIVTAVADKTEVRYNNGNPDSFTVKYIATGGKVIGAMAQLEYDKTLFTCAEDPDGDGRIRMNSNSLTTDADGNTVIEELNFTVKANPDADKTYKFIAKYVQISSGFDAAGSGAQDGFVENLIGADVKVVSQYDVILPTDGSLVGDNFVDKNTDYTAAVNNFDENMLYTIKYTMSGVENTVEVTKDNANGVFVVENVTGDIEFTSVTAQLNFELVLLPDVITGYTLVLVKDGVSAGYTYNGAEMYAIDRYVGLRTIAENENRAEFVGDILNATSVRAILVEGGVDEAGARAAIAASTVASTSLEANFDVNRNGEFYFSDAMTAHGCYKSQYEIAAKMSWYLSSDVNGDFAIDTDDYDNTVEAFWATVEE